MGQTYTVPFNQTTISFPELQSDVNTKKDHPFTPFTNRGSVNPYQMMLREMQNGKIKTDAVDDPVRQPFHSDMLF
jgi:hypothetical protein